MKRVILISVLVLTVLLSALSIFAAENINLRLAGGGVKGQWYADCVALAEIVAAEDPSIQIDVIPGSGVANSARVGVGEVEMALSYPTVINSAIKGTKPFDDAYPDIRGGFTGIATGFLQFAVIANTGLKTMEDIIDQKYPIKLLIGRAGTNDDLGAKRMLEFYGIDYDTIKKWGGSVCHVGYGDQVIMIKDGHGNAVLQSMGVPSPSIIEMLISRKMRLLTFSDKLLNYMKEKYAYSIDIIPKGTYGDDVVEEDIKSVASVVTLIFNKDVPEDVVYRIVKIICENSEKVKKIHPSTAGFKPEKAFLDLGAPLHPGAKKYYQEAGYIK